MVYKQGSELTKEIQSTEVYSNEVAIWSLGQSGVILKDKDTTLCIDPYLTYSIETGNPDSDGKRSFAPPLEPRQLQDINAVLITHFHADHMDLETLKPIAKVSEKTKFAAPASHADQLSEQGIDRLIRVADESSFEINQIRITPVEAAHTEYERDEEGNPYYFGYFIEMNGVRVFHSGDTVATKEILEKVQALKPDVAFLPINGRDYARTDKGLIGNMNYREAADFGVAVGTDLIIPNHFDMMPKNSENPAYFVDYLFSHYPDQKFHMFTAGERLIYRK
ncbi:MULTISPECIES: MBL fold metallo-hydrolase [Gracilibacillus]|uniref:MBL fold metallo-hydrolase n=1 Tax=Gracilibacillus TaxID=74385 RepID=UPI0009902B42|nr:MULTISPECIES: MBL fold metallo-hydrolase [Gracilibacillus]